MTLATQHQIEQMVNLAVELWGKDMYPNAEAWMLARGMDDWNGFDTMSRADAQWFIGELERIPMKTPDSLGRNDKPMKASSPHGHWGDNMRTQCPYCRQYYTAAEGACPHCVCSKCDGFADSAAYSDAYGQILCKHCYHDNPPCAPSSADSLPVGAGASSQEDER